MKNYIADDEVLNLIAPAGGVVSGKAALMGVLLVVPHSTVPEGQSFAGYHRGVFELPKVAADAATQLQAAYWDDASGQITAAPNDGGDPLVEFVKVGAFADSAAENDEVAAVLLTGQLV